MAKSRIQKELYTITVGRTGENGVSYNCDSVNVVAINAEEAIKKYKKKSGEFIQSAEMIATIHIE